MTLRELAKLLDGAIRGDQIEMTGVAGSDAWEEDIHFLSGTELVGRQIARNGYPGEFIKEEFL